MYLFLIVFGGFHSGLWLFSNCIFFGCVHLWVFFLYMSFWHTHMHTHMHAHTHTCTHAIMLTHTNIHAPVHPLDQNILQNKWHVHCKTWVQYYPFKSNTLFVWFLLLMFVCFVKQGWVEKMSWKKEDIYILQIFKLCSILTITAFLPWEVGGLLNVTCCGLGCKMWWVPMFPQVDCCSCSLQLLGIQIYCSRLDWRRGR